MILSHSVQQCDLIYIYCVFSGQNVRRCCRRNRSRRLVGRCALDCNPPPNRGGAIIAIAAAFVEISGIFVHSPLPVSSCPDSTRPSPAGADPATSSPQPPPPPPPSVAAPPPPPTSVRCRDGTMLCLSASKSRDTSTSIAATTANLSSAPSSPPPPPRSAFPPTMPMPTTPHPVSASPNRRRPPLVHPASSHTHPLLLLVLVLIFLLLHLHLLPFQEVHRVIRDHPPRGRVAHRPRGAVTQVGVRSYR